MNLIEPLIEEDIFAIPSYPVLVIISGSSAVGKDTVVKRLIKRSPGDFFFVVTVTSRDPREGEVPGVDYIFVSKEEFERMIDNDEFIEYAEVYGQYKGVPKKHIQKALASNRHVIMRVDVQGAKTLRELIPNAIQIFIRPTSEADLVKRMRSREGDTEEQIQKRIKTVRQEMDEMADFDYSVINEWDKQEEAVDRIMSIIVAAGCRVGQEPIDL